jgi:2-polyprenyl-3-methyl-5-hydroxy-6-metoxy-1,4-benzoquinol methylase
MVLDAGCGFGVMSVLLSLMGASEVQALDCHQGMIETFRTYLGILPLELPVYPRLGDVAALPYGDGAFDLVIVHEAISHFNDVDRFLLRPTVCCGSAGLIISDSNNALHALQLGIPVSCGRRLSAVHRAAQCKGI